MLSTLEVNNADSFFIASSSFDTLSCPEHGLLSEWSLPALSFCHSYQPLSVESLLYLGCWLHNPYHSFLVGG